MYILAVSQGSHPSDVCYATPKRRARRTQDTTDKGKATAQAPQAGAAHQRPEPSAEPTPREPREPNPHHTKATAGGPKEPGNAKTTPNENPPTGTDRTSMSLPKANKSQTERLLKITKCNSKGLENIYLHASKVLNDFYPDIPKVEVKSLLL